MHEYAEHRETSRGVEQHTLLKMAETRVKLYQEAMYAETEDFEGYIFISPYLYFPTPALRIFLSCRLFIPSLSIYSWVE